jgi:hypothetical protein
MRVYVCSAIAVASIVLGFGPAASRAATDTPAVGSETPAPVVAKFTVQIIGRVKKPGNIVLDQGARLSDALAAAGVKESSGCTFGGADLHRVFLTRAVESSGSTSYMIDVALAQQHKDLRYDPLLRANDRIFVPECRPSGIPILTPPMVPPGSAERG